MAGCVPDDVDVYRSERERAGYLSIAHETTKERFGWLAAKLEMAGHRDLAGYAHLWSKEHETIATNLRKQAR